jgi:acyl-coenzyme A synthetase/AMP-(fatty) acid ligase
MRATLALSSLLETATRLAPTVPALVMGDRTWTFAELSDAADQFAFLLLARGLCPGDRVALWLPNLPEAVVALWGVIKAGGVFVMVNATTKQDKLDFLLQDSGAMALVTNQAKQAGGLFANHPNLRSVFLVASAASAPEDDDVRLVRFEAKAPARPLPLVGEGDLAAILYTSGSTGFPKGVALSHKNIATATKSITEYLELRPTDVLFNVLPLSFGYGLTQLFSACAARATFVCEKDMLFPHVTLTKIAEVGATGFAIVPTIAAMLLEYDLAKYDLSSLRYVTNAGAHLPVEYAQRLSLALPHVSLICMYGQTECLRISYLPPSDFAARPESVGKGIPYQQLFLLDEKGNEVDGQGTGQLVVRGDHVMLHYWNAPEATAEKLRPPPASLGDRASQGERLLFTGDLFRRDSEGFLYFVSRMDDIIKSRGEKVSPAEVERALLSMPGVAAAAVVGVERPNFGTVIKAVIVTTPGVTLSERDVKQYCAARLENYMVPGVVEFREQLPTTERGKVDKLALR